tara:strand:- start:79 stop:1827 length:1749 start_codon:yes stop_codon:yes gene_type:complete
MTVEERQKIAALIHDGTIEDAADLAAEISLLISQRAPAVDGTPPVDDTPPADEVVDGESARAIDDILNTFKENIFGGIDADDPTKEDVQSGIDANRLPLDQRVTDIADKLEFDTEAQITDSDAELDLLFQTAKEHTARAFALDPSAGASGASQRAFEMLERDLALAKAQKRQQIRTQAGAEQRANVTTINSLLNDAEQRTISRAQLKLQERAQEFGESVTEAQLTGIYQKVGSVVFEDFNAAFGSEQGDDNYNIDYDFDGNGAVEFSDFIEFSKAAESGTTQTLAGRQLQASIAQQNFDQTVTRAGLTGSFDGEETIQNMQQEFENGLATAQIFGGKPPVMYTEEEFAGSLDAVKGDIMYRSEYDVNGDGVITQGDFDKITVRSEDLGNGVMMYQPPGSQTLSARELGLSEKQFTEAVRQFNQGNEIRASEFFTQFSGWQWDTNSDGTLALDEDGNPTAATRMKLFKNEITGEFYEREVQLSSLEREHLGEAQRQFDESMKDDMFKFLKQLGFSEKELRESLANDSNGNWINALATLGAGWARGGFSLPSFGGGGGGGGGGGQGNRPPVKTTVGSGKGLFED